MSLLNASGISFSYTGARPLLCGATFSLHAGDRVGLTGPNGAGKSTLLRLLSCDLTPDAGALVRRRGLHVEALWQEHAAAHVSGGERVRRELERCLASGADVLLLDEPTSHLDIEALEWLEQALPRSPAAMVAVSHDRTFLNRFARRIWLVERGAFREYAGNYDEYRERRRSEESRHWSEWEAAQRLAGAAQRAVERRQTVAARVRRTPAGVRHGQDHYERKAGKVMRTARLLHERAEEAKAAPKPWEETPVPVFDFTWPPRSGNVVLRASDLSFSYEGRPVWRGLDLALRRGDRVALAGANGAGKTTLLRVLAGELPPETGRLEWGARVRAGYLSQHGEDLDARSTALELCRAVRDDETWIRTLLGCWKMPAERVHRPASALSAGERTKVALARLLLSEVNLLLLDEPANHLEIESVEALAATLEQFPGTLVFATHDRWLAARLATRTVALPDEAGRTSSRTRR